MSALLGTLVNSVAVIIGGALGMLFSKAFPKRLSDSLFLAIGLCTAFIGITGIFQDGVNTLIVIVCMILGTIIGEIIDLDKRINSLGSFLEKKVKSENGNKSISEGFVSASLIFCVGAMAVVGSLQGGLLNDHTTIYTKSILDFVVAIIFASSLGVGVILSSVLVFLYQGIIALFSRFIMEFFVSNATELLSSTELNPLLITVNTMSCIGYLIILALALNMLKITKFKVMNFVPAIFLPIAIIPLYNLIAGLF